MDMSANFLTRLGSTEDSDYGNFWFFLNLRRLDIVSKDGIELRWGSLVVVYAIQPDPKEVHGCQWP